MNIAEYSGCHTDMDFAKITIGHVEGSNWWYRSGVMCACDCKVLIGSHPNPVLESA